MNRFVLLVMVLIITSFINTDTASAQTAPVGFVFEQPDRANGFYGIQTVLADSWAVSLTQEFSRFGQNFNLLGDIPVWGFQSGDYYLPVVVTGGIQLFHPNSKYFFFRDAEGRRFSPNTSVLGTFSVGLDDRFEKNALFWGERALAKVGIRFLLSESIDLNPTRRTLFAGHLDALFFQAAYATTVRTETGEGRTRPLLHIQTGAYYEIPLRSRDEDPAIEFFDDRGLHLYSAEVRAWLNIPLWAILPDAGLEFKPGVGISVHGQRELVNTTSLIGSALLTWTPRRDLSVTGGADFRWRHFSHEGGRFPQLNPRQHWDLSFGQPRTSITALLFLEYRLPHSP